MLFSDALYIRCAQISYVIVNVTVMVTAVATVSTSDIVSICSLAIGCSRGICLLAIRQTPRAFLIPNHLPELKQVNAMSHITAFKVATSVEVHYGPVDVNLRTCLAQNARQRNNISMLIPNLLTKTNTITRKSEQHCVYACKLHTKCTKRA